METIEGIIKMNDNIRKWKQTGLMEGLNESNKQCCADSLEDMANFLMENQELIKKTNIDSEHIGSVLIPIVRRLIEEKTNSYINPKKLFVEYIKFLHNTSVSPKTILKESNDIEAYIVNKFVKNYKGK